MITLHLGIDVVNRHPVENMFLEQFSWILNQEPWMPSRQVLSVIFSVQTTSYLDNLVPETIGQRDSTRQFLLLG
jgi:hypothetical protein